MNTETTNNTGNYVPYKNESVTNEVTYSCEAYNPVYQNNAENYILDSNNQYELNDAFRNVSVKPMRIKHISHLDLDGYGSTILTEILTNFVPEGYYEIETDNILPNRLNNIMKEVIDNLDYWDRVIITDLAINQELLDMINNSKNPEKIRVFDHHKCDLTNLPDNIIVTKHSPIQKGRLTCATELYYNFLKNDPIYEIVKIRGNDRALAYFVECVRVYDT